MRLPLDQNFPEPILERLEPWMGDVQLVPLRTIDHRLTTLEDRELLIALKQFGYVTHAVALAVARGRLARREVMERFGVCSSMLDWRLNMTGAFKRAQSERRRRVG